MCGIQTDKIRNLNKGKYNELQQRICFCLSGIIFYLFIKIKTDDSKTVHPILQIKNNVSYLYIITWKTEIKIYEKWYFGEIKLIKSLK